MSAARAHELTYLDDKLLLEADDHRGHLSMKLFKTECIVDADSYIMFVSHPVDRITACLNVCPHVYTCAYMYTCVCARTINILQLQQR